MDELRVTIAPKIFGPGVSLTGSGRAEALLRELDVDLRLIEVKVICGGWVHLRYSVLSPKEPLV